MKAMTPFPSVCRYKMNPTIDQSEIQTRIQNIASELSDDPVLGELLQTQDVENYLYNGLSHLLQSALQKDRQFHLQDHLEDRPNGFSRPRTLRLGTTPIDIQIPRTRKGFYPGFLPKYQRCLGDSYQELLSNILLQAKNFRSALRTMQAMGLGYSPKQMQSLLEELDAEAKNFFTRPLAADWLFLYLDAKVVQLKNERDQVQSAIHFLVIGVSMDAKKELLSSKIYWGNEQLECWKQVLLDLKNRGLTRILMLLTDDFSGLTKLVRGLFPQTDHQLCCVHHFRNAQRHLSKQDYALFRQTWQEIYACNDYEVARGKFQGLLDQLRDQHPAYVKHLQPRIEHYLAFMQYPREIQRHIRSTNLPEGINNLIETLKRNAGGHFHTEREARVKMKLLTDRLYQTKWKHSSPMMKANLAALTQLFRQRYEPELNPQHFQTQNS